MSKSQVERIRELEMQVASLQAQVAELRARPPIVINNPAPQVVVIGQQPPVPGQLYYRVPSSPDFKPPHWPTITCEASPLAMAGYPPTVAVGQNTAH